MSVQWEWATPVQDLPLVTSKYLLQPHSSLEGTRVAHERQAEWRKSFHSNKEVVFPKYFSHQKVLHTFPKRVEVWLEMNWWHCLFLQYRNLECNTIFYPLREALGPDLAIIAGHKMASSGLYWAMVVTLSCGMALEIHEAFGEKRGQRETRRTGLNIQKAWNSPTSRAHFFPHVFFPPKGSKWECITRWSIS